MLNPDPELDEDPLYVQVENSRPNSIYNLSGPPTDLEGAAASRPHSALTSYSNFHGQRRPTAASGPGTVRPNVTNLTQESLLSVSTVPVPTPTVPTYLPYFQEIKSC